MITLRTGRGVARDTDPLAPSTSCNESGKTPPENSAKQKNFSNQRDPKWEAAHQEQPTQVVPLSFNVGKSSIVAPHHPADSIGMGMFQQGCRSPGQFQGTRPVENFRPDTSFLLQLDCYRCYRFSVQKRMGHIGQLSSLCLRKICIAPAIQ
jgi:hypothetical protein